jgi:trehalose-6-phosphate synthase
MTDSLMARRALPLRPKPSCGTRANTDGPPSGWPQIFAIALERAASLCCRIASLICMCSRAKRPCALVPPSGLVTAIEPVLRACDGVWVAHGSGSEDAHNVDEFDRLRVPPDDPRYTLRRVWLSKEEEAGYYDGFANEGLWPLCHMAHTRPIFRASDWEWYQRVNEKFAAALLKEMEGNAKPIVFVQDYHFALVPRLIKAARPDARVAIFWHIPWPNAEAFGICPWQAKLLEGLLGADLIGFHIPLHCNNFLSTVDRVLEARTDREHMTARRDGHTTAVRPYPISVAFDGSKPERKTPAAHARRIAERVWTALRNADCGRGSHGLHQGNRRAADGGRETFQGCIPFTWSA